MKKWIAFMLVIVLGFVLVGCGDPIDDTPTDEKPTITKVEITGLTNTTL